MNVDLAQLLPIPVQRTSGQIEARAGLPEARLANLGTSSVAGWAAVDEPPPPSPASTATGVGTADGGSFGTAAGSGAAAGHGTAAGSGTAADGGGSLETSGLWEDWDWQPAAAGTAAPAAREVPATNTAAGLLEDWDWRPAAADTAAGSGLPGPGGAAGSIQGVAGLAEAGAGRPLSGHESSGDRGLGERPDLDSGFAGGRDAVPAPAGRTPAIASAAEDERRTAAAAILAALGLAQHALHGTAPDPVADPSGLLGRPGVALCHPSSSLRPPLPEALPGTGTCAEPRNPERPTLGGLAGGTDMGNSVGGSQGLGRGGGGGD